MTDQSDRQAYFEKIYRQTYGLLSRHVLFRTSSLAEAEDLVSTVYVDFLQHIALRGQKPENAHAYLLKMANHLLSRHYAQRRPVLSLDDETLGLSDTVSDGNDYEEALLDQHDARQVWAAVQQLPWPDQQVLTARFRFDMAFAEIARQQGQNESAIRVRYHRALKKLQKILQNQR